MQHMNVHRVKVALLVFNIFRNLHGEDITSYVWTSSIASSVVLVMRWAVFTALCNALRSATEQFP